MPGATHKTWFATSPCGILQHPFLTQARQADWHVAWHTNQQRHACCSHHTACTAAWLDKKQQCTEVVESCKTRAAPPHISYETCGRKAKPMPLTFTREQSHHTMQPALLNALALDVQTMQKSCFKLGPANPSMSTRSCNMQICEPAPHAHQRSKPTCI